MLEAPWGGTAGVPRGEADPQMGGSCQPPAMRQRREAQLQLGQCPPGGRWRRASGRFTPRPADWLRVAMSGGVCSILSVCAAGVTSGRRGGACAARRLRGPEAAGTLHLIYSSGFSRRSAALVTSPRLFTAGLEGGSAGGPRRGRGTPHPPIRTHRPPHPRPNSNPAPSSVRTLNPSPNLALLLNPTSPSAPSHLHPNPSPLLTPPPI